jgi:hypothetical protein
MRGLRHLGQLVDMVALLMEIAVETCTRAVKETVRRPAESLRT